MRRIAIGAVAVVVIAGCQGSDSGSNELIIPAPAVIVTSVGSPKTTNPTKIAIVVRKGLTLTVGYSAEDAFREFRDPKQYGNEYNDLPVGFPSQYRARSWETADFGFGEITHDNDLVAAMYHEDKVQQDRVDELVKAHQDHMDSPPTTIVIGKRVSYWFWELDGQRLMVCAFQSPSKMKGLELTVAMGDDVVMDALGMSAIKAQADQVQVDSALRGTSMRPTPPLTASRG